MSRHDVIVIGGGPAGSTTATLLARRGWKVLLLERERFPRFKVGESLMPATYWVLRELGMLEKLRATHFPRKYSVQFFAAGGKASSPFYFFENDDHESSVTWQVTRAEFDQLLLDNAVAHGVEARQGVAVTDVLFDGERARGVAVLDDGERRELAARVVVDASGQSALISRKLGLRESDDCLRNASLYTHYRGARRDPGIDEGATLILHTREGRSWFWYIPLPEDRVSVGVVGLVDYLVGGREGGPERIFEEELAACPALRERLAGARRVEPVRAINDFSYRSRRVAGDGWVLVGDAFGFLDPIYSSGVFLALQGGAFAARALDEALAAGEPSAARLGAFGPRLVAGMEALRNLVYAFYTPGFSFARFLEAHPEHRQAIVDLLVGNVFRKDVGRLFDDMRRMCVLPADLSRLADPLSDPPADVAAASRAEPAAAP